MYQICRNFTFYLPLVRFKCWETFADITSYPTSHILLVCSVSINLLIHVVIYQAPGHDPSSVWLYHMAYHLPFQFCLPENPCGGIIQKPWPITSLNPLLQWSILSLYSGHQLHMITLACSSKSCREPQSVWGNGPTPVLGLVSSPGTKSSHTHGLDRIAAPVALPEAPTCGKDVHRAVSWQPAWSPSRWHSHHYWQPAPRESQPQTCKQQNAPSGNQLHKHRLNTTLQTSPF